jgi:hypothetical protein
MTLLKREPKTGGTFAAGFGPNAARSARANDGQKKAR